MIEFRHDDSGVRPTRRVGTKVIRWPLIHVTWLIAGQLLIAIGGTGSVAWSMGFGSQHQRAPDVVAIKEGANLDLACPIVVPSEDMIISWTCDDEPASIRSSRIHVTEMGKLRIRQAKIGDSCNYRCEAADGYGTLSVIIRVIVVDKKLLDQMSRQSAAANQTDTSITITTTSQLQYRDTNANQQQQQQQKSTTPAVADQQSLNSNNNHAATSLGNHQQLVEQHNDSSRETLEVQIEPSLLKIEKNRTFSLECRVRHPMKQAAAAEGQKQVPQIIWLKEFIGSRPDSLGEAHEKNLVSIDNVYYHSLNWPRSITQSNKSSTTNSALLVRQSNLVHSGKYICFAGYPPYTMSSRLTYSSELGAGDGYKWSAVAPRYKMASAEVQVYDLQGGPDHLLSASTSSSGAPDFIRQQRYSLVSVVSTNSWKRNLTISLVVFCCILYVVKVIYFKYRIRKCNDDNNQLPAGRPTRISHALTDCGSDGVSGGRDKLTHRPTIDHFADNIQGPPQSSLNSTSVLLSTPSPTATKTLPNGLHLPDRIQPFAKIPNGRLDLHADDSGGASGEVIDEHLYSEIGDRCTQVNNNYEQEYYKVPIVRTGRTSSPDISNN